MNGEALSFSDVAIQTANFERNPNFKNLTVGNLSVEPNGAVSFTMNMNIDPKFVIYSSTQSAASVAPTPASASSAAAVTLPLSVATTTVVTPTPTVPATTTVATTTKTIKP